MCDISSLRVNGPSEPGRLRDVCVCQWVNSRFPQVRERANKKNLLRHVYSLPAMTKLSTTPRVIALATSNDCPLLTVVWNYVAVIYTKAETSFVYVAEL